MAETKETKVPFHFQNIYQMSNLEGVQRLLEHKLGKEGAAKFQTIDIFEMILAMVDMACASLIDVKEMNRRLDALEEGTIRANGKIRTPMDKYYAVMSGLQHSTVYCAEDNETGRLATRLLSASKDYSAAYIALTRDIITDRFKPGAKAVEMKMDDFITRCADEGIKGFIVDQGTAQSQFDVEEYMEDALTFKSALNMVNTIIGEGISGDLLFPALVSYMNNMIVDVSLKDGQEMTGVLVSLQSSVSTAFMVMDVDTLQSLGSDKDGVEWLRVHMTTDTAEE